MWSKITSNNNSVPSHHSICFCSLYTGAPDAGGKQFLIYFMENNVESPRYLPLEVYVTPVRAQAVNVRIESPTWFEPAIREDAYVSLLSSIHHNNANSYPLSIVSTVYLLWKRFCPCLASNQVKNACKILSHEYIVVTKRNTFYVRM